MPPSAPLTPAPNNRLDTEGGSLFDASRFKGPQSIINTDFLKKHGLTLSGAHKQFGGSSLGGDGSGGLDMDPNPLDDAMLFNSGSGGKADKSSLNKSGSQSLDVPGSAGKSESSSRSARKAEQRARLLELELELEAELQ